MTNQAKQTFLVILIVVGAVMGAMVAVALPGLTFSRLLLGSFLGGSVAAILGVMILRPDMTHDAGTRGPKPCRPGTAATVDTSCPACGAWYRLRSKHLGRKARCGCGKVFVISSPADRKCRDAPGMGNSPGISLANVLYRSWLLMHTHYASLLIVSVLCLALTVGGCVIAVLLPWLGVPLLWGCLPVLFAGMLNAAVPALRGRGVSMRNVFAAFGCFKQLWSCWFLQALIMMTVGIPVVLFTKCGCAAVHGDGTLGDFHIAIPLLTVLAIVVLELRVVFLFAEPLCISQRRSAIGAMRDSYRMSKSMIGTLNALVICNALVIMLSCSLFALPFVMVGMPFAISVHAVAYDMGMRKLREQSRLTESLIPSEQRAAVM